MQYENGVVYQIIDNNTKKILATYCMQEDAEWYIKVNKLDAYVYPIQAL